MRALRFREQFPPHVLLTGLVIGMLVAGLGVPLLFAADPRRSEVALDGAPDDDFDWDAADDEGAPASGEDLDGDGLADDGGGFDAGGAPGSTGSPLAASRPGSGEAGAGGTSTQEGGGGAGAPGAQPSGEGAAAEDQGSSQGAGGRLTATDRGVTEDTIRFGVLLLDTASLSRVGIGVPGVDPEEEREAWEAYFAEVNERGGVNGRLIEPHYRVYDVFNADDMKAACLELTQDRRVFAVTDAGGYFGAAVLCVTEENATPLFMTGSQGMPQEFYDRSQGRLFTTFRGGRRAMENWAYELHRAGHIRGKTLGILSDQRPGQPQTAELLRSILERHGYEVAHVSTPSEDLSAGASEIPVEVQQMRAKGVDAVLIKANIVYANQFVQTADSQGWRPGWFITDWQNAGTDVFAQGMPDSYHGAIGMTQVRYNEHRVGAAEPEDVASCMRTYTERTGKRIERGSNQYGQYTRVCIMSQLVTAALDGAGPQLTRPGFQAAIGQLGEVTLGDLVAGSFRSDKPQAADYVRTISFDRGCRCYLPVDDWRRTRF